MRLTAQQFLTNLWRRRGTTGRALGAAGSLAIAALLGLASLLLAAAPAEPARGASSPTVREFTIEAREADWEIAPGTVVKAWTYGGTIPGPELRVTEGDLVRITLMNALPVPTSLHWHGVDVPNAMDGVPGLTQDAVPPGGFFTYQFTATNPGTRWYHSHQDAELQVPLGLYGPLIIEPRQPEPVQYDREYTYVLSEWALSLTPQVALGEARLPRQGPGAPHSKQLDFDLFLMNGRAHESIPPVEVREGERVRLRLINAGSLVHTIHLHGHSFKLVATDGNPVPKAAQLTKDSVTLGPSERADLEIVATNPGVWMLHCHMEHHMANGMMTTLRYQGVEPLVTGGGEHAGHLTPAPAPNAEPEHAAVMLMDPLGTQPPAAPASGATVIMSDNRFRPSTLKVARGTTVTWLNHGVNLHTVSELGRVFESGSVPAGGTYSFTFDQPGTYRYLCRQHFRGGMAGTVIVE